MRKGIITVLCLFSFGSITFAVNLIQDTKQDFMVTGSTTTGVKFTDDGWVVMDTMTVTIKGYSNLSNSGGGDWLYRRKISVDNQNLVDLYNFQVMMKLTSSIFNYSGRTNVSGTDIRFVDSDGVTEIPYWIEVWNSSGDSKIWVKISTMTAQTQKDIYMYYGNISASGMSRGTSVFDFFDDFEDSNFDGWNIIWGDGWSATNKFLSYSGSVGTDSNRPIVKLGNFITANAVLEAKVMFSSPGTSSSNRLTFLFRLLNTNSYTLDFGKLGTPATEIGFSDWMKVWLTKVSSDLVLDNWYTFSIKYSGSSLRAYRDGNLVISYTLPATYYSSGTIGLGGCLSNNLNFDDVKVRKYANIEPIATVGAEENIQRYTASYESPYYNFLPADVPLDGTWQTVYSTGSQPLGTELRLQIATSNDDKISPVFRGPNGNLLSYYTIGSTQTIYNGINSAKYLKYKLIFNTADFNYILAFDKIQIVFYRYIMSGYNENIQINISTSFPENVYFYITTNTVSDTLSNVLNQQIKGNHLLKQIGSKVYSVSGYREDNTSLVSSDLVRGITCEFNYLDNNNDGYLDGTLLKTSLLHVFYFDTAKQKWLPVSEQAQENKLLRFTMNKLPADFVILAYQQQNNEVVSELFNYPNPFSSVQGTTFTYLLTKDSKITVRIYNLLGDLVRKMEFTADSPQGKSIQGVVNSFLWDGYNDVGMKVANGAYICELIAEPVDGAAKQRQLRKIAVLE